MTRRANSGPGVLHVWVGSRVSRIRGLGVVEVADTAGVGIDWDADERNWWTRTDGLWDLLAVAEIRRYIIRLHYAEDAQRRPGAQPVAEVVRLPLPDLLLFGDDDPSGGAA
jgi:hypothetical protein